ncbi:MAG: hypothetical protein HY334_03175 [Armatimonadetes bacterium]|nr:hypothetical protein [Armatimonadota bacterium]
MDLYMAFLRLVHIFSGVFWVGTIFYFALFLLPRIKALGPDGGKVMQHMTGPPFPTAMTAAGGLVTLSGILLYWRDLGGFQSAWIATPTGLAFTIGGLAGLLAFGEGFFVSRPATEKMGALGREIAVSGGAPTAAQAAEMQRLAGKLEKALYRTAYVLIFTLIGMSVAPYL